MTQKEFYAAITEIGGPVFEVGLTEEEALKDAQGEQDPSKDHLVTYRVMQCSGALYDRVGDIGGDVIYLDINGRLVLPDEI